MHRTLKTAFRKEMALAWEQFAAGDLERAFAYFERAHILGQSYIIPHTASHLGMLRIGWRRRDPREIQGQIVRIIGSLLISRIWVPIGNTGGSNVSALSPMPIPSDLAEILAASGRPVLRDGDTKSGTPSAPRRLLVFFLVPLSAIAVAGFAFFWDHHRQREALEAEFKANPTNARLAPGSTDSLSILPLVNWHRRQDAGDGLRTEVGVSYLIKTDRYTILFDLGQNAKNESPSPLENNMRLLNVSIDQIDTIFLSHLHFDHVGGRGWSRQSSFSIGSQQIELPGVEVFTPVPMSYPGLQPVTTSDPRVLMPGVATTGTIPRQLVIGRIDEQALAVNVRGLGLVLIVGCGHQTLGKIIARTESVFPDNKIYGVIGDLHYPVPSGRLEILGLNTQRIFASGNGPFSPIESEDIEADIVSLQKRNPGIVALGGHDSSDETIARFAEVFGDRYRHVRVGEWIHIRP